MTVPACEHGNLFYCGDCRHRADAIDQRIRQHRAEDARRAADAAESAGCRVLVERLTGAHIATDPAAPTVCFAVTTEGCTCRHFGIFGRCGHHALLLAELGLIEDAGDGWDRLLSLVACPDLIAA